MPVGMGQLFFKKPLQDAIRAGAKRTTIRRWSRPMMKAGNRAWSPGLGFLSIDAVECIDLECLDNSDAIADGFATMSALRDVLFALYPDHARDGKQWYRVCFKPEATKEVRPDEQGSLFK